MKPPLDGLRVVDASGSVAGEYAGRLLSDHGADVLLVEPPQGSPTRQVPSGAMTPGALSHLFEHLNGGKRSLVLDLVQEQDLCRFATLVEDADVVLLPAERRSFVREAEQTVTCNFADFDPIGPYRTWRGSEMIHQAMSGVMAVTGRGDKPPLYGIGHRASYAAGVTAYTSILAALLWREDHGRGQEVTAITAEVAAAMGQNLISQYSYSQSYATRQQYPGMLAELECADGWIVLFALRGWPDVCRIFEMPQAALDPRFATIPELRRNWATAQDMLRAQARTRSAADLVEDLQAAKVSAAHVLSLSDLIRHPHFKARDFFLRRPDGTLALGPALRMDGVATPRRPAPRLGSETSPSWPHARWMLEKPICESNTGAGPLSGIRVLDFTTAWAGPMATRSLAFLGADVVRVENPRQIDPWRGPATAMNDPRNYPLGAGGNDPFNRNAWFNTQNHDKRSIALDLRNPEAVVVARRLAAQADLVVANYSPGVLDKLGLGHRELSRDHPNLVTVEMPAFGNSGPWSRHVGMGKTMEAAAGMASLIGYGDDVPVLTGPAYLDPIGGLHGAAAALTGLLAQRRGQGGRYIEVAQVEAAIHWIGEYVLHAGAGGSSEPYGNAREEAEPHDAFPCQGIDEWCTIAIFGDEDWIRLAALAGPWACNENYQTHLGRRAHRAGLIEEMGAWTRNWNKHDLAARLQAHGVCAGPVNTGGDLFRDPALRASGFITRLYREDLGEQDHPGLAYRLSATPGRLREPAPRFGEDWEGVLMDAGFEPAEIRALFDRGVVSTHPQGTHT